MFGYWEVGRVYTSRRPQIRYGGGNYLRWRGNGFWEGKLLILLDGENEIFILVMVQRDFYLWDRGRFLNVWLSFNG